MTVQELYDWAVENNATDGEIEIQFGAYGREDSNLNPSVECFEYGKVVSI